MSSALLEGTNRLLDAVGLGQHPFTSFAEIADNASSLCVAVFEALFATRVAGIVRRPRGAADYEANAQLTLDTLRALLPPRVAIPPDITGAAVAAGDVPAIAFLVALFLDLDRVIRAGGAPLGASRVGAVAIGGGASTSTPSAAAVPAPVRPLGTVGGGRHHLREVTAPSGAAPPAHAGAGADAASGAGAATAAGGRHSVAVRPLSATAATAAAAAEGGSAVDAGTLVDRAPAVATGGGGGSGGTGLSVIRAAGAGAVLGGSPAGTAGLVVAASTASMLAGSPVRAARTDWHGAPLSPPALAAAGPAATVPVVLVEATGPALATSPPASMAAAAAVASPPAAAQSLPPAAVVSQPQRASPRALPPLSPPPPPGKAYTPPLGDAVAGGSGAAEAHGPRMALTPVTPTSADFDRAAGSYRAVGSHDDSGHGQPQAAGRELAYSPDGPATDYRMGGPAAAAVDADVRGEASSPATVSLGLLSARSTEHDSSPLAQGGGARRRASAASSVSLTPHGDSAAGGGAADQHAPTDEGDDGITPWPETPARPAVPVARLQSPPAAAPAGGALQRELQRQMLPPLAPRAAPAASAASTSGPRRVPLQEHASPTVAAPVDPPPQTGSSAEAAISAVMALVEDVSPAAPPRRAAAAAPATPAATSSPSRLRPAPAPAAVAREYPLLQPSQPVSAAYESWARSRRSRRPDAGLAQDASGVDGDVGGGGMVSLADYFKSAGAAAKARQAQQAHTQQRPWSAPLGQQLATASGRGSGATTRPSSAPALLSSSTSGAPAVASLSGLSTGGAAAVADASLHLSAVAAGGLSFTVPAPVARPVRVPQHQPKQQQRARRRPAAGTAVAQPLSAGGAAASSGGAPPLTDRSDAVSHITAVGTVASVATATTGSVSLSGAAPAAAARPIKQQPEAPPQPPPAPQRRPAFQPSSTVASVQRAGLSSLRAQRAALAALRAEEADVVKRLQVRGRRAGAARGALTIVLVAG